MVRFDTIAPAALRSRVEPAFIALPGTPAPFAAWQLTSTYGTGVFAGSTHAHAAPRTVDVPAVPVPMVARDLRDRAAKQASPPRGESR